MDKKEIREVTVTYCDYCGKEITPPYSVIYKNGQKFDLCSDYKVDLKNCFQKFKDEKLKKNNL